MMYDLKIFIPCYPALNALRCSKIEAQNANTHKFVDYIAAWTSWDCKRIKDRLNTYFLGSMDLNSKQKHDIFISLPLILVGFFLAFRLSKRNVPELRFLKKSVVHFLYNSMLYNNTNVVIHLSYSMKAESYFQKYSSSRMQLISMDLVLKQTWKTKLCLCSKQETGIRLLGTVSCKLCRHTAVIEAPCSWNKLLHTYHFPLFNYIPQASVTSLLCSLSAEVKWNIMWGPLKECFQQPYWVQIADKQIFFPVVTKQKHSTTFCTLFL